MFRKKTDLAIVNRGFWPHGVVGEALMQLSENFASTRSVCVITQSAGNLREEMESRNRGRQVRVLDCLSRSDSSSGFARRTYDASIFMVWTFVSLIRCHPSKVYVSTNPPVAVPFAIFLYCRLFGAYYYYHLQDIHPEATNIVLPINPVLYRVLQWMDSVVMRNAKSLITLSEDMQSCIVERSATKVPIYLVSNPGLSMTTPDPAGNGDVVFCGNAGRLQRIPLLLEAIRSYLAGGGRLKFTFIGGGLYSTNIQTIAQDYSAVKYLGYLPPHEAASIVAQHSWALAPIQDEVTRYAFPSKLSSYVLSGCRILAICGKATSVARWVQEYGVGTVCEPDVQAIVENLREIEAEKASSYVNVPKDLKRQLEMDYFVRQIAEVIDYQTAERLHNVTTK